MVWRPRGIAAEGHDYVKTRKYLFVLIAALCGIAIVLTDAGAASAITAKKRETQARTGLNAVLRAHPLHSRSSLKLSHCPVGRTTSLATVALKAAGSSRTHLGSTKTTISKWSSKTDHGELVSCALTGPTKFITGVFSHAHAVPKAAPAGFGGPYSYRGGRIYRRVKGSDKRTCQAIYVPAVRGYLLSVQFHASKKLTNHQCAASIEAIRRTELIKLAAHR